MTPPSSQAAIANLADVGIKEFLVKDGRQFLRLSIPSADHQTFRKSSAADSLRVAQENLELPRLRFEQVGFTNPSAWTGSLKDVNAALSTIKSQANFLTASATFPDGNDPVLLATYRDKLIPLIQDLLTALRNKDIEQALQKEEAAAEALAKLRLAQAPSHELPFQVPDEYSNLPRLKGRALVRMVFEKKKGFRLPDGNSFSPTIPVEIAVDGYHAPITAGNFIDLVKQKAYDDVTLGNIEELTVNVERSKDLSRDREPIPLELFYKSDDHPVYGATSDDDRRALETFALPFQAYGALGMGRENNDPDTATTNFFLLKWMQALVPPGRNTLDGYYSCFGYVVKNEDFLKQLEVGDRIVKAEVVEGLDNLFLSG